MFPESGNGRLKVLDRLSRPLYGLNDDLQFTFPGSKLLGYCQSSALRTYLNRFCAKTQSFLC